MKELMCSWAIGGFIFLVLRGTKTPISLNEWSYFCSLLTFMTTSTSLWPCSLPIETTRQLNVKGNFAFDLICLLESVEDLIFLLLIQMNLRFLIFIKERLKYEFKLNNECTLLVWHLLKKCIAKLILFFCHFFILYYKWKIFVTNLKINFVPNNHMRIQIQLWSWLYVKLCHNLNLSTP